MITNDYLKTKLKAERQKLDELTDRNGFPLGSTGDAIFFECIKARIAMLEEIMADLDLANRSVVILSISKPRPAFE